MAPLSKITMKHLSAQMRELLSEIKKNNNNNLYQVYCTHSVRPFEDEDMANAYFDWGLSLSCSVSDSRLFLSVGWFSFLFFVLSHAGKMVCLQCTKVRQSGSFCKWFHAFLGRFQRFSVENLMFWVEKAGDLGCFVQTSTLVLLVGTIVSGYWNKRFYLLKPMVFLRETLSFSCWNFCFRRLKPIVFA